MGKVTSHINSSEMLSSIDLINQSRGVNADIASLSSKLAESSHVVTIESFNGVTDTDKMNDAITSITSTGGTIKLKNKTYTFDRIILPVGVSIVGSGNTILQPLSVNQNSIITIQSKSVVRDLNFIDNGLALKSVVEVGDYYYSGRPAVSNVLVENLNINLTIANNGGIKVGYGSYINIHQNTIINTHNSKGDFGIVIHSDNSDLMQNVFISNNYVSGFVDAIAGYGTGSRYYITIEHNQVVNSGTAIDMYHSGLSSVIGNIIKNCNWGIVGDTEAIDSNFGRGNIIANNQVHNCTGIGIYTEELRAGVISGNTVQGCDIGIYGGASITYTSIENNVLTYNRVGLMISNDYVPSQMQAYDNGDLKIANNIIAFNSQNGLELAGIRGLNIIENNDIRSNNTSNGDYYAIMLRHDIISSISRNNPCEQVIVKGNTITNMSNTNVTHTTGYQKGLKSDTAQLYIVNNIFNNATTELNFNSCTIKFMYNTVLSSLATPTIMSSVTQTVFGNTGLFEGQLVSTANVGISFNAGINDKTQLPTPSLTNEGTILKVNRNGVSGTNVPALLYFCQRQADGSYAWKTLKGVEGNATINASSTSVVVTHGMNSTPTIIQCTAQGNIGNVWVSNPTLTQFTINCATAPVSNTIVSWEAKY
jgi:parallel beta-helix repeat protein